MSHYVGKSTPYTTVKMTNLCLLLVVQSPPRIIKQPPTDELLFQVKTRADESDKPFIIECEADGEPAPE